MDILKAKAYLTVAIHEYVPDSIVIKSIINKHTGNIKLISIDGSKSLNEKAIPFDTFIQVIDGNAEIIIGGITNINEKDIQLLYLLIHPKLF